MKKNSAFILMVQKEVQRSRRILVQMCLDAAMIAANEVFNMGPGRCEAFCSAFNATMDELARMTLEDGKDDKQLWHTKAVLDERLKAICGDKFQPWATRYQ